MDRELKRGTLEMVLLKLLSTREMYGYEIISALQERSKGEFLLKDGTLYPVLYRLEQAGYIKPRWETPERGVPRKYYRITPSGARQLETLIEEWQAFSAAVSYLLEAKRRHV